MPSAYRPHIAKGTRWLSQQVYCASLSNYMVYCAYPQSNPTQVVDELVIVVASMQAADGPE